jgi:hypothetical protein
VLHPQRKRPLRALRITASDPSALPYSDRSGWLYDDALAPPDHHPDLAGINQA